ncbi:hypothetical protein [Variovorax ginsengisoli]|uniref:DNA cytosine methyltransferase n=1 Tax=Variovorax ginsengisoli TaxID=363844 RepID=A0ABT8RZ09_9BURK|nr:hypothetical protein [Variovorax ginsengisoli]MDN8612742.1 hypothetical protein [Variovorax ginsengisoli]MDO1531912.1 hypothetical protein [Variovorax ginsengisoli]
MKREELPPIAIFLCDESGIMAQPWAEAGVECYCVDMSHSIRRERVEGLIHYVWGDCRTWRPPEGRRIVFVAAFPPCTHVTGAGARDFVIKGGMMLRDALETFEACRTVASWSGAPYLIENPVGVLSSIPHIGKPDHYFHPSQYTGFELTDNYTKLTALWVGNGFVMPEPFEAEGLGEPDDRIHKASPGADRATIRSKTPAGFARAVFQANYRRELESA